MFIRNPYNYDADAASLSASFKTDPISMTQQEFADEVNINHLVSLFMRTGIPQASIGSDFVEFAENFDFQSAMDGIVQTRLEFQSMPAVVRDRFNNDPLRLLSFLSDPLNRDEAIKYGLVVAPPVPVVKPEISPASADPAQ